MDNPTGLLKPKKRWSWRKVTQAGSKMNIPSWVVYTPFFEGGVNSPAVRVWLGPWHGSEPYMKNNQNRLHILYSFDEIGKECDIKETKKRETGVLSSHILYWKKHLTVIGMSQVVGARRKFVQERIQIRRDEDHHSGDRRSRREPHTKIRSRIAGANTK